jgi:hypothetical protein
MNPPLRVHMRIPSVTSLMRNWKGITGRCAKRGASPEGRAVVILRWEEQDELLQRIREYHRPADESGSAKKAEPAGCGPMASGRRSSPIWGAEDARLSAQDRARYRRFGQVVEYAPCE